MKTNVLWKGGLLALGAGLALTSLGCDKLEDLAAPAASGTAAASAAPTAAATATAAAAAASADATAAAAPVASVGPDGEPLPLTLEQYEALVLAVASCKTADMSTMFYAAVDSQCPAYKALTEARSKKNALKNISGKTGPLARKMLADASPAARVYGAGMMESLFGTSTDDQKVLLDAAKEEKNVDVLKAMLHAIANNGKRNPEVGELLLKMAAHESPQVRATAAVGIASSWNKGMPGGVEKLIELIEKDPDPMVSGAACGYAGELGDDRLVPIYTKYTGPKANADFAVKCFPGLLKMWASWPLFTNANEGAYKLTMKLLTQKPRNDKMPPWSAMSTLGFVGKGNGSSYEKWRESAKWYSPAAVKAALLDIAADNNANWMARNGAIRAVVDYGGTKAELGALKKKIGAGDKFVMDQVDKSIAAAK